MSAILREIAAALFGVVADLLKEWLLRRRLEEAEANARTLEAHRRGDTEARAAYEAIKAAERSVEPVRDWTDF